jgi:hypothetical protein
MEETTQPKIEHRPDAKPNASGPLIHRVCISCNNMFVVPLEKYEEKHCPACHKE